MSLFGRIYRTFTFGQSHAKGVGCVIDGFPSGFKINLQHIQSQLNRRKPGQSSITTPRKQDDIVQCISGIENNVTLGKFKRNIIYCHYSIGCPLTFFVKNQNIKKTDYDRFSNIPRPGHADYAYKIKYGVLASSGGGRSSARETVGRIISGALAKQFLKQKYGIQFAAWVYRIQNQQIPLNINNNYIIQKILTPFIQQSGIIQITHSPTDHQTISLRCPHKQTAIKMYNRIKQIKQQGDSIGGIIQGCVYNLPKGLGQPVFDKIQAYMAHGMLSIPATKGFEFGSGFEGTKIKGSQHNDLFRKDQCLQVSSSSSSLQSSSIIKLMTNNSGGSLGGVSSGETFHYKVAFKPVSTISKPQNTVDYDGNQHILQGKGRHDPCVLPRAPAIVDNMAAMVIMDLVQLNKANQL